MSKFEKKIPWQGQGVCVCGGGEGVGGGWGSVEHIKGKSRER